MSPSVGSEDGRAFVLVLGVSGSQGFILLFRKALFCAPILVHKLEDHGSDVWLQIVDM